MDDIFSRIFIAVFLLAWVLGGVYVSWSGRRIARNPASNKRHENGWGTGSERPAC